MSDPTWFTPFDCERAYTANTISKFALLRFKTSPWFENFTMYLGGVNVVELSSNFQSIDTNKKDYKI